MTTRETGRTSGIAFLKGERSIGPETETPDFSQKESLIVNLIRRLANPCFDEGQTGQDAHGQPVSTSQKVKVGDAVYFENRINEVADGRHVGRWYREDQQEFAKKFELTDEIRVAHVSPRGSYCTLTNGGTFITGVPVDQLTAIRTYPGEGNN